MKDQIVKCFLCDGDHGPGPCPSIKAGAKCECGSTNTVWISERVTRAQDTEWRRHYSAALARLIAGGQPFTRTDLTAAVPEQHRGNARTRCQRALKMVAAALDGRVIQVCAVSGEEGARRPRYVSMDAPPTAPPIRGRRQIFARGVAAETIAAVERYAAERGKRKSAVIGAALRRRLAARGTLDAPLAHAGRMVAVWVQSEVVDAIEAEGATAAGALRAVMASLAAEAPPAT